MHINAFNFPVWGMLEKLAPTLLAGMPAIVKPATSTAYLTELVVRRIIESKILPEGALQLVCGSLGNLFEHLNCQDTVSFTGSAQTAAKLRVHPTILRHAAPFVAETDSLNSSILALDAVPGTPDTITAIAGRWVPGSRLRDAGKHPFRIPFNELTLGDTLQSDEREVTVADIEEFAALSGDNFYAHMNEAEAARNPLFGGRVAHGYFLISAAAGLFVDPAYGPVLGNYGIDELRFVKPVKPGEKIKVRLTCARKSLRADKGWGEVAWDTEITNQAGETVTSYFALTMVSVHAVPDAFEH